jgi:hypothetical protein
MLVSGDDALPDGRATAPFSIVVVEAEGQKASRYLMRGHAPFLTEHCASLKQSQRQIHNEAGSLIGFAVHLDASAMLVDDLFHDCESQPGAAFLG